MKVLQAKSRMIHFTPAATMAIPIAAVPQATKSPANVFPIA